MIGFVAASVAGVPAHSPRRLLFLELYASILSAARVQCRGVPADSIDTCIDTRMLQSVPALVEREMKHVFDLHTTTDPYQVTVAVEPILGRMVAKSPGSRYAGIVMQLTADTLGSENPLVTTTTGDDNHMLNTVTASMWLANGFLDNAVTKLTEAIDDLDHAPFPDAERAAFARSALYDRLAQVYRDLSRFDDAIVSHRAAETLSGPSFDEREVACTTYYLGKDYRGAGHECGRVYELHREITALYWRAKARKKLDELDAAVGDYEQVAASRSWKRTDAAIALPVVQASRKDYAAAIDPFERSPCLFDVRGQRKSDLAVIYNNRCCVRMQLGEFDAALTDCTESLRYGNLPDAFAKQQKLIRLVEERESGN